MRIDMHAHYVPEPFLDEVRRDPGRWMARLEEEDGRLFLRHDQGFRYPVDPKFYRTDGQVAALDAEGLDGRILSIAPSLFYYWADRETAVALARLANDAAAELVRRGQGRLAAMAHVPLPYFDAALAELERAVGLGLTGVEMGTSVEGRQLDEPEFRPLFQRCAELDVPVFLHPYYVGDRLGLNRYYFTNSVGNPLDTTLAIGHLIHGGVLAQFPRLRVVLAHAAGFFPYQRGRMDHAYRVRQEPKVQIDRPPTHYLDNVYCDTITHWPRALRFLVETVGAEKVMLGSDFPFDMGPADCVADVLAAELGAEAEAAILGANAAALFGVSLAG